MTITLFELLMYGALRAFHDSEIGLNSAQVFAMPQSGTGVSVEAVDPVFQTKMMDMLKQTGRYEPR